jgi:hypothetical protein
MYTFLLRHLQFLHNDDPEAPEVQHNFDLDEAPSGEENDLAAFMGEADSDSEGDDEEDGDDMFGAGGDEFDMSEDEDDELAGGLEHDSAFDTSEDEKDDADGDDNEDEDMEADDEVPPHLRPNPSMAIDDDEDLDGQITTNLMGDITASEFTLPAVTKSRAKTAEDVDNGEDDDEEEQFDELEGRTSLRDVEARMRWLVGVLGGKEKDEDGEVIPGQEFRGIKGL